MFALETVVVCQATRPIQAIEHDLRDSTARYSGSAVYDELVERYARYVQIGLNSMKSAIPYIIRGAK